MSIHTCGEIPSSIYCTCYSQTKQQQHHYRQHNKTKQTYGCCDTVPNPVNIVEVAGGCSASSFTSPVTYLEYLDTLTNLTDCVYSQFFGGKTNLTDKTIYLQNEFPELYDNALTNMQVYNNFFCDSGTEIPKPTLSDHQVSCTAGYVPYLISYQTNLDNTPYPNYVSICQQDGNSFDKITTGGTALNYSAYYYYTANSIPCVNNSCSTNYESGNYNNLANQSPIFNGKEVKDKQTYLIAGCVLLVLGLIIFGVLSYYIFRPGIELVG